MRNPKAYGISERSGMKFPISEMIKEPGTGFFVHRSESDGMFNAVDHPQANLHKYAVFGGDPTPTLNARPDRNWAAAQVFQGACKTGALIQVYAAPIDTAGSFSNISVSSSVTSSPKVNYQGSSSLTGAASLTSAGIRNCSGESALTGAASFLSAGIRQQSGSATSSASASVTSSGEIVFIGNSAISGSGVVSASAIEVPILIDDFEQSPFTGLLDTWVETATLVSSYSTTRTTTSVIEGTYSWKMAATVDDVSGRYELTAGPFDLTGCTHLKLSVTNGSDASQCYSFLRVYSGAGADSTSTLYGTVGGSTTLSRTLSILNDITDVYIKIGISGSGGRTGVSEAYFDRLRGVIQ